jgi:hypothetical protein
MLGVTWATEHRAWAWPMKDGNEAVVGIRLRSDNGDKWAVTGSHQGCFIPAEQPKGMALITEGPTDAAAGLDLGYWAIGRPSCSGGGPQLKQLMLRHHIRRVVIICDNDEPGAKGAMALADLLPVPCAIVVTPAKDLRDFKRFGGTREMLDSRINSAIWRNV